MNLHFTKKANINLKQGDIAIQTTNEFIMNFTHSVPNYCLGAPVFANP
jgi:hypothetical protein